MYRVLSGSNLKKQRDKLEKIRARELRKQASQDTSQKRKKLKEVSFKGLKPVSVRASVITRGSGTHRR